MAEVAEKWGLEVARRGFAQVPNHLLLLNQFLDIEVRLSPLELLLLIQLAGAWWKKDEPPFPSMRTLAQRCGTSERQVLRAVAHLEKLGLLQRVKRRSKGLIASNSYDLIPLARVLGEVAEAYPNEFPRKIKLAVQDDQKHPRLTSPPSVQEEPVAPLVPVRRRRLPSVQEKPIAPTSVRRRPRLPQNIDLDDE